MVDQRLDLQQIASDEVTPDGEHVVWCGRPDPLRLAATTIPSVIFGVPWTAFSVFWIYAASGFTFPPDISEGGFSLFPLFGVPFVLIGLGMLLSPLYKFYQAGKTLYIITDKSARIVIDGNSKSVRTFSGSDLKSLRRTEKSDGSGDLLFSKDISVFSKGRRTSSVGFFGIPNVRFAEQSLLKLRESSRR